MTHPMLTWLEAQLLQDELAAREGGPDSWHTKECGNDQNSAFFGDCSCDVKDQVLADIASKRAILAIHVPFDPVVKPDGSTIWLCGGCSADDGYWHVAFPCPTVRALVSAYASRPGYVSDWGPT